MDFFTIKELEKSFPIGDKNEMILKQIDLTLKKGEMTALVGASGSGKSTLLTIAAGLQRPTKGHIYLNEQDLTTLTEEQVRKIRAEKFGFIFQAAHLIPFLMVEEQLEFMLDVAHKKPTATQIEDTLALVGLSHRKKAYPASLSGGEKQRVAIARAIIHSPELLFADEPTASLDSKRSVEIMELLQQLTKTLNLTTLLVTHDLDMLNYADTILEMKDGKIVRTNS